MHVEEAQLKEWQRKQRLARTHVRRGAIIFGITGTVLVAVQLIFNLALSAPFLILGILSLTVVGDAVQLFHCRRQIRKLGPTEKISHEPNGK